MDAARVRPCVMMCSSMRWFLGARLVHTDGALVVLPGLPGI
jgi:hypothetical protein